MLCRIHSTSSSWMVSMNVVPRCVFCQFAYSQSLIKKLFQTLAPPALYCRKFYYNYCNWQLPGVVPLFMQIDLESPFPRCKQAPVVWQAMAQINGCGPKLHLSGIYNLDVRLILMANASLSRITWHTPVLGTYTRFLPSQSYASLPSGGAPLSFTQCHLATASFAEEIAVCQSIAPSSHAELVVVVRQPGTDNAHLPNPAHRGSAYVLSCGSASLKLFGRPSVFHSFPQGSS
jgi:hypothetical protein